VEYRIARPADAAALADFAARLFVSSYEHLMERGELEAYVRDHFSAELQRAELADPAMITFLATDAGICGYAQLLIGCRPDCTLESAAPAALQRIYVDHAWHGRGIAPELLRLVEAGARGRGCDALWLAVWEINDRAISFYRKSGFAVVGRQGFPIGSEVQTDYVMAKPLATELQ
jgi:ribosomal protein S18 acetylase RimI-like enzyme